MKIYFTTRQIPELASLSKEQVRVTYAECVKPAWRSHLSILWLLIMALGVVGGVVGSYTIGASWGAPVGAVLGSQIGLQIYTQIIFERTRPEIRRYLGEHKHEIQQDA
jgi:hypothetical protein